MLCRNNKIICISVMLFSWALYSTKKLTDIPRRLLSWRKAINKGWEWKSPSKTYLIPSFYPANTETKHSRDCLSFSFIHHKCRRDMWGLPNTCPTVSQAIRLLYVAILSDPYPGSIPFTCKNYIRNITSQLRHVAWMWTVVLFTMARFSTGSDQYSIWLFNQSPGGVIKIHSSHVNTRKLVGLGLFLRIE